MQTLADKISTIDLGSIQNHRQQQQESALSRGIREFQLSQAKGAASRKDALRTAMGGGDRKTIEEAAFQVSPEMGMKFRAHYDGMDEQTRQREIREAGLLSKWLPKIKNQQQWTMFLDAAQDMGVDTTDMPEAYDPDMVGKVATSAKWISEAYAEPQQYSAKDMVKVAGPDGTPRYVPATQAVGAQAYEKPDQGKLPGKAQEYEFARQNGFQGSFMDYVSATRDKAMNPLQEAQHAKLMQDIQQRDQKQEAETRQASITQAENMDVVTDTIAKVDQLINHPGREAGTGMSYLQGMIPGTQARDFAATLETLKSKAFLNEIQKMKGMGALSEAEGRKLADAAATLDPGMSEEAFEDALYEYRKILSRAQRRIRQIQGGGRMQPATPQASQQPTVGFEQYVDDMPPDARQAPDGQWYIQRDGDWYRVSPADQGDAEALQGRGGLGLPR